MKNGIIIAGNLIVDYVKQIDAYPGSGMLCNIRNVKRSIGGCVANTGIDIVKMDNTIPIKAVGNVGDDENGKYIIDCLVQNGIDTKGVIVKKGVYTSFTDVMTNISDGSRTFFQARGANACFGFEDIDFSNIQCDLFHIGYALLLDKFDSPDEEYGTVMAKTLAKAQEQGYKTSIDVVSENSDRYARVVTPSLKYCNYAILNEIESSNVCGIPSRNDSGKILNDNIQRICLKMFDLGVKDIVCIHAPEGGWYMDKKGHCLYVPSLDLPNGYVKGTVGAGDAFCAGILYSIYKGFDAEYSLRLASAVAAASLSYENSIDGIMPLNQIMQLDAIYRH